jgi:hypothetical protein
MPCTTYAAKERAIDGAIARLPIFFDDQLRASPAWSEINSMSTVEYQWLTTPLAATSHAFRVRAVSQLVASVSDRCCPFMSTLGNNGIKLSHWGRPSRPSDGWLSIDSSRSDSLLPASPQALA